MQPTSLPEVKSELIRLRKAAGLSQEEAGHIAGLSQSGYQKWEDEGGAEPGVIGFTRLALGAFNKTPNDILLVESIAGALPGEITIGESDRVHLNMLVKAFETMRPFMKNNPYVIARTFFEDLAARYATDGEAGFPGAAGVQLAEEVRKSNEEFARLLAELPPDSPAMKHAGRLQESLTRLLAAQASPPREGKPGKSRGTGAAGGSGAGKSGGRKKKQSSPDLPKT